MEKNDHGVYSSKWLVLKLTKENREKYGFPEFIGTKKECIKYVKDKEKGLR